MKAESTCAHPDCEVENGDALGERGDGEPERAQQRPRYRHHPTPVPVGKRTRDWT